MDETDRAAFSASLGTLDVPDGWEPVVALCQRVAERADMVVESILERILDEIPAYSDGLVPPAEMRQSVTANLAMMLQGTAERRGPRPEELELCRELGDLRAREGQLPVDAVIQAFVLGYRELWDAVVRESRGEPPEVRELLFIAAATVWEWVHAVTHAIGAAYQETTLRCAALTSAVRERFFDALLGGNSEHSGTRELAHSLGFDSDRRFQAIAISDVAPQSELRDAVATALSAVHGQRHVVRRGELVVVLDQGGTTGDLIDALDRAVDDAAIGVGATRVGLVGAAMSMGDAEQALMVAHRSGRIATFERDWHEALVIASEDRLADLLSLGVAAAQGSPELARTIRTFADSGFSMSQTARVLHVHTNTVTYRLQRWAELTGWDPRTHDGLVRSMAALALRTES